MLLQCKNVSKHFGRLAAVSDLSFGVEEGEIFGIAGPNGAGKTTLFNLITGIHKGSGDIIFDTTHIEKLRPYKICHRGIARTFQIPQIFPSLSVYKNVFAGAFFGSRTKPDGFEQHIEQTIDFVGLSDSQHVSAANLKLLDKKLTMLATALATKPKMLLLDEPISGLNPKEAQFSTDLFRRINEELHITIVIIEHFMKILTQLSNRLMILQNGQKLCCDTPAAVTCDERVVECYLGDTY